MHGSTRTLAEDAGVAVVLLAAEEVSVVLLAPVTVT